jgi:hypothetical protein
MIPLTLSSYLKNHQRWRNAVYREVARLRSEGKTLDSPEMTQFTKLLIKGDDNVNEFDKRTTTEWRGMIDSFSDCFTFIFSFTLFFMFSDVLGQMLAEKNVFFDAETGKLGQGAFGAVYKGTLENLVIVIDCVSLFSTSLLQVVCSTASVRSRC